MGDSQDWENVEKMDERKIGEVVSRCRYISSCERCRVESDSKRSATQNEVRPNFPKEDGGELEIYDQTRFMTKRPGAPEIAERWQHNSGGLVFGLTARCLDFLYKGE